MSIGDALLVPAYNEHYQPSGGGPPPKLLLDDLSPASFAMSAYRKLRSAYAGPALRVRRSSDSTQLDIGFAGIYVDIAAMMAFVGSGNGNVVTWYDQSGNGRNYTGGGGAPPIVLAGVLQTWGQKPLILFNASNTNLVGLSGFTGDPDITLVQTHSTTGGSAGTIHQVGAHGSLVGDANAVSFYWPNAGLTTLEYSPGGNTGRRFSGLASQVNPHSYLLQRAAGMDTLTVTTFRQDGVVFAGTPKTGALTLNITNQASRLNGNGLINFRMNLTAAFPSILSEADLGLVLAEAALHL